MTSTITKRAFLQCILHGIKDSVMPENVDISQRAASRELHIGESSEGSIDFKHCTKNNLNYGILGSFEIKVYCPVAFGKIRERFNIWDTVYVSSFSVEENQGIFEKSAGRSKAMFYTTYDNAFCIKIISHAESLTLRNIFEPYFQHIQNQPSTFLPIFFGFYRIKINRIKKYILVMNNVFNTHLSVTEKYDIKGATISRESTEEDKAEKRALKDVAFIASNTILHLGDKKGAVINQIFQDCQFLENHLIMDYSLLIGIHHEKSSFSVDVTLHEQKGWVSEFKRDFGGICASNGKEIYLFGIIDILQSYNTRKKIAHAIKSLRYGGEEKISTINPVKYSQRFRTFLVKCMD